MSAGGGSTRPKRPSITSHWLSRLGFSVTHQGGVSRAWRLDLGEDYLLVTDVGGYDLPGVGESASGYRFTNSDDLLEFEEILTDSRALYGWIRSARRRARRRVRGDGPPAA